MNQNILLISYHSPPSNATAAIRLKRTVNKLSEKYNISVLTKSYPEADDEWSVPRNVSVYRLSASKFLSRLTYRPNWLIKSIFRARKLIKENTYDLVWSRFTPIAPHIVGLVIKKEFGLPWVGYFGDPWINSPYRQDNWEDIAYIESLIVNNIDKLTFSNSRQVDWYTDRYQLSEKDCTVVPNFINPSEVREVQPYSYDASFFHIVHLGNLYGIRSPKGVLSGIKMLPKGIKDEVKVHFVGQTSRFDEMFEKYDFDDTVVRVPRVPQSEAIARGKGSDALLLIDAPVRPSPFLPMKLIEYLFMNNPIVGATPKRGTAADVIQSSEAGVIAPPDEPQEICRKIVYCYKNTDNIKQNNTFRSRFTAEVAIGKLISVIENLVD